MLNSNLVSDHDITYHRVMTVNDITPPVVLVTGPTTGIGAAMVDVLIAHHARPRLVLLARDPLALERCVQHARAEGLDAVGVPIDLADLASVRTALDDVSGRIADEALPQIDVAILNAGAQFADRRRAGHQGYELTFTVNVVAQHLLLRGVEPLLAPSGHVVVMGSSTHRGKRASFNLVPDPRWERPEVLAMPQPAGGQRESAAREREWGGEAYATSKLALVTLAHDWAARLARTGRRLNTYDPGLVAGTGLGKDMPAIRYWVWKYLMPAMSVLPGATTAAIAAGHGVDLAMSMRHAGLNGGYVEIGRASKAEALTFDDGRRAELWSWLESTVADWLPHAARGDADGAA